MPKFVIAYVLFFLGGLYSTLVIDVSWGIYLYELNYFLNPVSRWWYKYLPDLRYTFVIAIVISVAYALKYKQFSNTRLFDVPQSKWLLMNAMLFSVISFWAVWPDVHNPSLQVHIKLLIFLYIAYKVIDDSVKFERMIWAFLAGNFYLGWVGHGQGRSFGQRMEGFGPADCGGDGNCIALILVSSIPILLHYLFNGKKWQRFLTLIFIAYIIDAVVLVNSRGAFLGLIVAISYFTGKIIVFNRQINFQQKIKFMIIVTMGCLIFVYLTDAAFWERMSTIETEAASGYEGGGRTLFWLKTFKVVAEHPFGVGTWGYQFLSPQFIPERFLTGGRRAVHSLYFQCLAERGYLGFVLFAGLILSNFLFIKKIKKYLISKSEYEAYYQITAIEAGFVAFLTGGLFINRLHAEVLYMFMMFIACFGNINFVKKNRLDFKAGH